MKPQTEELLYFLLWTFEGLASPTWRNLDDSFENWAWRNRLTRRLAELERQKLIERHPAPNLDRIVRLTESGRCHAMGGRDPAARWARPWDGRWRIVLFDIPSERVQLRQQLWRILRRHHFGYLQGSVWVSPDSASNLRAVLGNVQVHADAFLIMEGRPAAGESDQEIVAGAWQFSRINRAYEHYLRLARNPPDRATELAEWARQENTAWHGAVAPDPLLPRALLPRGYLGEEAFHRREQALIQLAHHFHGTATVAGRR